MKVKKSLLFITLLALGIVVPQLSAKDKDNDEGDEISYTKTRQEARRVMGHQDEEQVKRQKKHKDRIKASRKQERKTSKQVFVEKKMKDKEYEVKQLQEKLERHAEHRNAMRNKKQKVESRDKKERRGRNLDPSVSEEEMTQHDKHLREKIKHVQEDLQDLRERHDYTHAKNQHLRHKEAEAIRRQRNALHEEMEDMYCQINDHRYAAHLKEHNDGIAFKRMKEDSREDYERLKLAKRHAETMHDKDAIAHTKRALQLAPSVEVMKHRAQIGKLNIRLDDLKQQEADLQEKMTDIAADGEVRLESDRSIEHRDNVKQREKAPRRGRKSDDAQLWKEAHPEYEPEDTY